MKPSLENIYISPLELCNLHCQYCYTHKTKNILKNRQILDFIRHYRRLVNLKSIVFCGGEVFTLRHFPRLVNKLIKQGIFITIITNGTIDRLQEIKPPRNCQLLVSFDGPQDVHDHNRGSGNFNKSVKFVEHALKLGFPTEIFFLVTKDSYPFLDTFNILDLPKTYLVDRLGSLTPDQVNNIRQNYRCYPPTDFGCSVLSLQSDGKFYGCCESSKPIGSLSDPIKTIIDSFLLLNPRCCDPKFQCHFHNS
jgi:hypothetical protein